MLKQLPVHEKHAVNRHVFCFHKSRGELKERLRQLQEAINLSPSVVGDAEL
jgi:hypothetical protein